MRLLLPDLVSSTLACSVLFYLVNLAAGITQAQAGACGSLPHPEAAQERACAIAWSLCQLLQRGICRINQHCLVWRDLGVVSR